MVCWISFFAPDREMFISGDLVKADVFKPKLMFDVCHSQGGVWLGSTALKEAPPSLGKSPDLGVYTGYFQSFHYQSL